MRYSKVIVATSILAGVSLGIYFGLRKPKLKGTVVYENLFEPAPGFGLVYRIEIANDDPCVQRQVGEYVHWMRSINSELAERNFGLPFVFVGEPQELTDMDRNINVGDTVVVDDRNIHMWSLDGDPVLIPDKVSKPLF